MGVFYTESPASRLLCRKSAAETFELLVLNTSIIRPASNRYIRTYLERLHGAPYEPLHPCLREVLCETFGVMVYQEDVVNVCAAFAGMPLASGDGLRKALSKKRPVKQLAAYAEEFFAGAAALGRDPETSPAGLGDDHVVRWLQLLQGSLGVLHPGGPALAAISGPTTPRSSTPACWPTAAGSTTRSPTWPRRCGWDSPFCRPTSTTAGSDCGDGTGGPDRAPVYEGADGEGGREDGVQDGRAEGRTGGRKWRTLPTPPSTTSVAVPAWGPTICALLIKVGALDSSPRAGPGR